MPYDMKSLRALMKPMRLLVVDDEEVMLLKTSALMRKFFDNVDNAHNGEEALAFFNAGLRYDVVLTDVHMPSMDGWELIARLRVISPDLFIGAMSGSATEEREKLYMCDEYLKKPATLDDMMSFLGKVAQKRKLND